jgi:hypothetical protein
MARTLAREERRVGATDAHGIPFRRRGIETVIATSLSSTSEG